MDNNMRNELEEFVSNSEAMYGFLARFYREEIDKELLNQLSAIEFPSDIDVSEIAEGYKMLNTFVGNLEETAITDLAADYARIFLGCGPRQGEGAFPYESVYTSSRGILMQEARDEVVALYRSEGLARVDRFNEPEDHITFELEFMEYLCQKVREAIENGDDEIAGSYFKKQEAFLEEHLMNWVPDFCADVQRVAGTDFYKAVAKITSGYLKLEQELIKEVV